MDNSDSTTLEASILNITSPLYSNGGGKHKSRI